MRLLLVLVLSAAFLPAADNQLTPAETAARWHLLFDGSTFANWELPSSKIPPGDSFTIEDGCLKAVPHPKINEDLFTTATFTDFELELDWKISKAGNSGIKYRIQQLVYLPATESFEQKVNAALGMPLPRSAKGQDYVIGFEYQITDNADNPDAKRNGPRHSAGALYDIEPPTQDATKPVGEFNHTRIVLRGDHVEHWLNGTKVVDTSLKSPAVEAAMAKRWGAGSPVYKLLVQQPHKRTRISLQNHEDAAWFKNIKIR